MIQLLGSSLSDHTNCSWNELWMHIFKKPYVKPYASNTNCVTLTPPDTAAVYGRSNGIIEASCYIIQTSLKKQKNCTRCSTYTAYTNFIHTIHYTDLHTHVQKLPQTSTLHIQATSRFTEFLTHAAQSVLFSTKYLIHNFIFFCSDTMIFINHELKYNDQLW